MRPDIVPGAVFPDYELSDHTAKRRFLSGSCARQRRQCRDSRFIELPLFSPQGESVCEAYERCCLPV
jgi:hypothetical protein